MYNTAQQAMLALSWLFAVICITVVSLRFYCRHKGGMKWLADDWLCLVALIATLVVCFLTHSGVVNSKFGADLRTLTPASYPGFQKHLYFHLLGSYLSLGFSKISVIVLYKRTFPVSSFQRSADITLWVSVAWMIAAFFTQIFAAFPISDYWTLGAKLRINQGAFILGITATDVLINIVIYCLPLPVIKTLQVQHKQKVYLFGIFTIGAATLIMSIVRLYLAADIARAGFVINPMEPFWTRVAANNIIFAVLEDCLFVIAACIPTLGPALKVVNISPFQSLKSLLRSYTTDRSRLTSYTDAERGDNTDRIELTKGSGKSENGIRVTTSFTANSTHASVHKGHQESWMSSR